MSSELITADEWFAGGTRCGYDPAVATVTGGASLQVFQRLRPGTAATAGGRWTTFLPGFPDGSYGYSRVDALLGDAVTPRLFVEYVGQGDSDKPRHYRYGGGRPLPCSRPSPAGSECGPPNAHRASSPK